MKLISFVLSSSSFGSGFLLLKSSVISKSDFPEEHFESEEETCLPNSGEDESPNLTIGILGVVLKIKSPDRNIDPATIFLLL